MNRTRLPSKTEIQNADVIGITVLNDRQTFTNSEGSFWMGGAPHEDTDDIEQILADNLADDANILRLNIDALPYLVRASFLFLGINPEGLNAEEMLAELNKCSVSNEEQQDTIEALRLALDY